MRWLFLFHPDCWFPPFLCCETFHKSRYCLVSFMIVVSSAQTSFFLFSCSPFLMTQLSAVNLHYRHILYSTACSALIDVKSQSYPFSEDFPHRRFDFSFANVGQPMPCKDHSEYFHTKFRHAFRIFFFTPGAKENVAFLKLSLKFLASRHFPLLPLICT